MIVDSSGKVSEPVSMEGFDGVSFDVTVLNSSGTGPDQLTVTLTEGNDKQSFDAVDDGGSPVEVTITVNDGIDRQTASFGTIRSAFVRLSYSAPSGAKFVVNAGVNLSSTGT